ncbi:hypothetical protein YC2023_072480 [Brassica napus]
MKFVRNHDQKRQVFDLELDWFSRYHPQTQLLRLVAVDSVSKQSYKPLQIASNRSEPLKIKSWFQLAFAVAGGWLPKTSCKYTFPIYTRPCLSPHDQPPHPPHPPPPPHLPTPGQIPLLQI